MRLLVPLCCLSVTAGAWGQANPFGVCAHLGGHEYADHERELELMEQAGIRWARADFSWSYFQPARDEWRFDRYDTIVEASRRRSVTLLPILCYNVNWAFPAHEHLDDWCNYVRVVVERYKEDLRHWEVWNEPNIGFWKPEPNPEQYTALLKATYETIKAIDPDLQVVYGGTAGIPFDYLRTTFELGAMEAFDILAVHPYRYPRSPEAGEIGPDLKKTWALLAEFGGGKPIWITELGWPTHINAAVGDGAFPAALIRHCARLRFPNRDDFSAAVLHEPGLPGCGQLGPLVRDALDRLPDVSARLVSLGDLEGLAPEETQILVLPTGEHYPAEQFAHMLQFVRQGGLLAHLGGVPLYYASRRADDGQWESPFAGEGAREALHVGWKAWWTQEGVPREASRTVVVAPEDRGLDLPPGRIGSTRWLTDTRLQGDDRCVPLLAAYEGEELVGYPVALYLYDGDLKGAFLGTILDLSLRGVTLDTQALYLPRAYLLSLGAGVESIFWYEFRDGGTDATYNEHRFGALHHEMEPKPAYRAYQAMVRALGRGQFVRRLDVGEDTHCLVFDAGDTLTAAVWRDHGEAEVRLRIAGHAPAATGHLGEPAQVARDGDLLSFTATEAVVYITGLRDVAPGE